jgi:hypothetical protein
MTIVIKDGKAYQVVSVSKCGTKTLLRPTQMPMRAVVTLIAAQKLTDIAQTMRAALAPKAEEQTKSATTPPAPRNPPGAPSNNSSRACAVGSYGPRHLVRQSLRRLRG